MFKLTSGAFWTALAVVSVLFAATVSASSEETRKQTAARVNFSTVTIVTGPMHSSGARLSQDLSALLNQASEQDVLSVLGSGSFENIQKILYLDGLDAGIVHMDVLDAVKRDNSIRNIYHNIMYITPLSKEAVVLVAHKDISTVSDLAGRTVNFGPFTGSGYTTPELMFRDLGIDVQRAQISQLKALGKIAIGEIAATVIMEGQLKLLVSQLRSSGAFRVLPLPQDRLSGNYLPATLTGDDVPGLLRQGEQLGTVAVRLALVVNNWPTIHPRYKKVSQFIGSFFSRLKELQKPPYDPKWKGVKLTTILPNWQRMEAADSWVALNEDERVVAGLERNFLEFVSQSGSLNDGGISKKERSRMFVEFLKWGKNSSVVDVPVRRTKANGVGKLLGILSIRNTEILVGSERETALVLTPNLKGLRPGSYNFNIHQNPACGPALRDGVLVPGLSAGGHLWVDGSVLVGQVDDGRGTVPGHLGTLPDLVVEPDGTATLPVVAARLSLADVMNRSVILYGNGKRKPRRLACAKIK